MYVAIIPAFNEEESIATIIQKTKKYVDHVIVVDDHSTDNTEKIARLHGATVICHPRNMGVGAAMKTGIAYIKKFLEPSVVITIDADGQHMPEDIPRLIQPIVAGEADIVLGSRFLQRQLAEMSITKNVGNKVLTALINLLAGMKLTDTQTGFRAFNRKALLSLNLISDFTYTQEMILVLRHKGFSCAEIPVQVNPRKHGQSKVASKINKYALKVLVIIFSTYLRLKSS